MNSNTPKKVRSSNLELLRIVAMLMVVCTHLLTTAIRDVVIPDPEAGYWVKFATQWASYLTWTCVNLFVLISGWFAIRPTRRKVASYIFNVMYFAVGIFVACLLFGDAEINDVTVANLFVWIKYYWFLGAYLVLMIFAPALNAYVEHSSRRQLEVMLICFYVVQTAYDCVWAARGSSMFDEGYGPLSFMGLYLLGRYMRLYKPAFTQLSKWTDAVIVLSVITITTLVCVPISGTARMWWITFANLYTSPNTLVCTVFIFLFFSKLRVQSRVINWLAASAFAVYLLHTHFAVIDAYFRPLAKGVWENYSGWGFAGAAACFICFWFAAAVVLDQGRKILWRAIDKRME